VLRISITLTRIRNQILLFTWTRIRIRFSLLTFTRNRIRILFLYQVMRICDHWSTDPPQLHFAPLRLHCERSRLSMVQFTASTAPDPDPDPAFESGAVLDPMFYSYADLDSQNDADPCGSGSGCTTLLSSLLFLFFRNAKVNLRKYSFQPFLKSSSSIPVICTIRNYVLYNEPRKPQ
jgi:hypothetical protein